MERNELKLVYDTLLHAPGMEENIKIDLRISRKVALFLVTSIDRGLDKAYPPNDLLSLSTAVSPEELREIARGMLEKSGLSDMYSKLGSFKDG